MSNRRKSTPGWIRVRFADVVEHIAERAEPRRADDALYVGLEHLDAGSLVVKRWGSETDLVGTKLRMRKGDILFARRNAYLRRVAIAPHDGLFSAHGMVLRPKGPLIEPDFLPFFMQSDQFMDRAQQISVGSLSPTINWTTIREEEFDLPSLEEQRRASRILKCVLATQNGLADADDAILSVRESCRDRLCDLSHRASSVRLDKVCTMQNGKAFPGGQYCDAGVRLLRPGNLAAAGTLAWDESKTTHLPDSWMESAEAYVVREGDVLINLTAQSLEDGFMGRVCMASAGDECLLNQRIGRFVVDESQMLPEFLFRSLQTTRFKTHAISNCEGSKVKHLFWSHLAKFELPLPPVSQQIKAIEHLAEIDRACRSIGARRLAIAALRHAVLSQVA